QWLQARRIDLPEEQEGGRNVAEGETVDVATFREGVPGQPDEIPRRFLEIVTLELVDRQVLGRPGRRANSFEASRAHEPFRAAQVRQVRMGVPAVEFLLPRRVRTIRERQVYTACHVRLLILRPTVAFAIPRCAPDPRPGDGPSPGRGSGAQRGMANPPIP